MNVRVVFMDRWEDVTDPTGLSCSMCHHPVWLPTFRDAVEESLCHGAVVVCVDCKPELLERLNNAPGGRTRKIGMG